MQWSLNDVPNQPLLNTAGWRFIVPQLYKKYPNADMSLNIFLPSPPVVSISEHQILATTNIDLIIDVVEGGEKIPVACISLVSLSVHNEYHYIHACMYSLLLLFLLLCLRIFKF